MQKRHVFALLAAVLILAFAGTASGIIKTDSIETRHIAAGSITASKIAAGTITADKMNVSTLSAIAADLGTVTAGSVSGVTGTFGSGNEVTLNASGISITSGTNASNYYKFNNTTAGLRYSAGGTADVRGANGVVLISDAGSDVGWDGQKFFSLGSGDDDLGSSSQPWRSLYLSDLAGAGTSRFVCHDNNGKLYSSAGTCDGSAPAPADDVVALRQEVAELRALVAQLAQR